MELDNYKFQGDPAMSRLVYDLTPDQKLVTSMQVGPDFIDTQTKERTDAVSVCLEIYMGRQRMTIFTFYQDADGYWYRHEHQVQFMNPVDVRVIRSENFDEPSEPDWSKWNKP